MDDSTNMSPTELQLRSVNERLKKTMKEMEELYSNEEEKSYQRIRTLLEEQKELKEKIENLQNRLENAESFSSAASSAPSSPSFKDSKHDSAIDVSFVAHPKNEHSTLYKSLCKDYAELQDNFQTISDDKSKLESKVDKMTQHLNTLKEVVANLRLKNSANQEWQYLFEDLQLKNEAHEEEIQKLKSINDELCQTNQELYKTVCRLQSEIDDLQRYKLNESPMSQMSLFDEIEAVKLKEFEESGEEDPVLTALTDPENDEAYEPSLPEIIEHEKTIQMLAMEKCKIIGNRDCKKSENSAAWLTLFRAIIILSLMFFIIYVPVCAHQKVPIFFFISPHHFHTKQISYGIPPM
jgi:predicted  nucleic acid-binding Zn-ribbon protein